MEGQFKKVVDKEHCIEYYCSICCNKHQFCDKCDGASMFNGGGLGEENGAMHPLNLKILVDEIEELV